MPLEPLTAISPVDGRYREIASALTEHFSEYALIRARVHVEIEYLIALSATDVGMRKLTDAEMKQLRAVADVSLDDAKVIKKIEKEGYEGIPATNHDVKAVEYFIKSRLRRTSLVDVAEWTHFALTSEDVNSMAYGLMLRDIVMVGLLPSLAEWMDVIGTLVREYAATPMLSRTHGQPATPTTFGKEMRVFHARIERQLRQVKDRSILVKFGGATGSYNAHVVAVPNMDWQIFAKKFVEQCNGQYKGIVLVLNPHTTQIEPHDTYAELFDAIRRINTILIDFSQDIWQYISDGWVTQIVQADEVGSSAMPHKVNPIDFENAEGNLGIANALFEHFSRKLPISRLQRDLSDSTVERSFGTAFAHSLIAYTSLLRGLRKIKINTTAMQRALVEHPEVLAEAIQTVLRKEGVEVPYEKLKSLTRGMHATLEDLMAFVDTLSVSDEVKTRLKALRPENYIGIAEKIANGE